MFGLSGILLALGLMMYLAYRGVSVLVLAPVLALMAALLSGQSHILGLYTQVFMKATGGFIISYFPLFIAGAIFGKMMDDCGAAESIARWIVKVMGETRAIMAIILACAVLTYGGVSLFVVAFAMYPIAARLFRHAHLPKRLLPATIALGAFTFTMTALPGSPAIQNAIPAPYFGTTPWAAPWLGVIAALIMAVTGYLWIAHQAHQARKMGEGYGRHGTKPHALDWELREHAEAEGFDIREVDVAMEGHHAKLSMFRAILPVLVVILGNYLFSTHIFPRLDASYLQRPEFGGVSLSSVMGIWSTLSALVVGALVLLAINGRKFKNFRASLDGGANASVVPVFNTASMVGFGAIIASLPAFECLRDLVLGGGQGNMLVSLGVSINALAGLTGSASGGMSIALQTLGETYKQMATAANINPELLHRVTTIATGGLDTLPHNGAVITLLGICNLTHREAYKDLFMAVVPGPLLALVAVIALGTAFGSF